MSSGISRVCRVVTPSARSSFDRADQKRTSRSGSSAACWKPDRPSTSRRLTPRRRTASSSRWASSSRMCSPTGCQRISSSPRRSAAAEVDTHRLGLQVQPLGRLVAAEQQAGLRGARGRQELQAERGLARARRADHRRHRGFGDPPREHRVERGDPGRHARPWRGAAERGRREQGLGPREDGDALAGDAERVLALEEAAAADLVDQEPALAADAERTAASARASRPPSCARAPTPARPLVSRNMVQSVAEASVCSSWVNRFISNPAPALASTALMPSSTSSVALWARTSRRMSVGDPLEPLVLEGLVGAEVGHPVGDEGRIEEPHRAQVRQHAAVVLARGR